MYILSKTLNIKHQLGNILSYPPISTIATSIPGHYRLIIKDVLMQHTGDKPIFSQFYRIEYVIYSNIYKRETKSCSFFRMASPTECEGGIGWARCLQTAATPATRSPADRPERYCCRPRARYLYADDRVGTSAARRLGQLHG